MTVVVGLDLSLTGTGVATADGDSLIAQTVASKGSKDDSLSKRAHRLRSLHQRIVDNVPDGAYVAIETPAYNQTGGKHHDRSGLWWLVVDDLHRRGISIVEFSTTTVKRYATGNGGASKMEVMAATIRRHPDIEIRNDNESDAVVLAQMLRRLLDEPIDPTPPKVNLAALDVMRPSMGQREI